MKEKIGILLYLLIFSVMTGCAGVRTFHEYARAGDTVALAAGWKHHFASDNITVTFTPAGGSPITYLPDDPAIRAVVNLYPDPLSSLVVSDLTNQNLTPGARIYADMISLNFTGNDKDWWQTTVFLDLPSSITTGICSIHITNSLGETADAEVEIIEGIGQSNTFDSQLNRFLSPDQLLSMERLDHFTVTFSGATVPYAMQLEFLHDPDVSLGGAGVAHVTNPRGDLKNLVWTGDGTSLKVVITPAKLGGLDSLKDCKFYVAGGITNLSLISLQAVDQNGDAATTITASIE